MKIKFTPELMGFMGIFQRVTNAGLKDCFVDDNSMLTFVVTPGELGKAIGKGAENIRALENAFNRKIKIVEFNPELRAFIRNLVYPSKVLDMNVEEDTIVLTPENSQSRGYLIGRAASNLRNYEHIVQRYFHNIKVIKVL